ncbi:hypothetical protein C8Q80DRAFT_1173378 [Daedaleopsis nitida]|nr:hypothetical protein C8Q80DRAFT_1173378 [Daedaleopsis nitida]
MNDHAPFLPDADTFFNSSLFFNTSLKLAHRFFSLPSRALARLRRLDYMALDLHEVAQASQLLDADAATQTEGFRRQRGMPSVSNAPPMPGPWGFMTSGYFLGVFIMAFVLNRIQNIVVPPRRPQAARFNQHHFEQQHIPLSIRSALLGLLFPVDISSTSYRLMFRLPTVYFLMKSLVIWATLLLQTQDPAFFTRISLLQPFGDWVAQKTMIDICWSTFMATCFTLIIGSLTTGLEGLNINENAPFNLFAFAFQLYFESASHLPPKESELPSRPSPHTIITIMLPLLQLTGLHCLEIKSAWSRYRFALSAAAGTLSVLHFHYVFWFSSTPYPLTTYAARVVETIMISIISVTVALNALTQLLTEGAIVRPLFAHAAIMPRSDEDYNYALFRLGTASMDATAVAGFGNEVGGVSSARPRDIVLASQHETVRGELEIDRAGVSVFSPAYEQRGAKRVNKKGFANEIAHVKAKAASTDLWINTIVNVAWHKHLLTFLGSMWRAARRVWAASVSRLRGASARSHERSPSVARVQPSYMRAGSEFDADPYELFLRGESVSDDEDDFQPEGTPAPERDTSDTEDEDEDEDRSRADEDDSGEQAQLFADLSSDTVTSAPLLLAHMTDPSSSPLTRRRYRRLVSGGRQPASDEDDWDEFVMERRKTKRSAVQEEDLLSENTHTCVICTVEPRDIICWPCRCLALCDDCRNNLASRSSASKHTCPCCRRNVEGYSKIYIP